jgi:hypothetical protein
LQAKELYSSFGDECGLRKFHSLESMNEKG